MNNFQTILVAIFLAFFVFAVLIFSGAINIGSKSEDTLSGKITVWGTFPSGSVSDVLDSIVNKNENLDLGYSRKDQATYEDELIEAFANGKGPDLFIVSTDMIQRNLNFIYKMPYSNYSERNFKDSYIDGANIYTDSEGVLGYPIIVDPIVLYYNKDILSNEGIVNPPKTWDELFTLNETLTNKENNGTIHQSMIGLGQYGNINNAKDILSMLLIQNDNYIVERNDLKYTSVLGDNPSNFSTSPAETVLKFFIEFSNPSNVAYSWNRSLPNSLDMFTSGKLAFYLGRASELFNIETLNPNLSFDVTSVPQIKDTTTKRTYGEIYAVVVSKNSSNISTAFRVANELSSGESSKNLSVALSLPPASRSLLTNKPEDPYLSTFFNSALISRSWPDPDESKSNSIFEELVDNILSNKLSMYQAINKADGQLELLNKK